VASRLEFLLLAGITEESDQHVSVEHNLHGCRVYRPGTAEEGNRSSISANAGPWRRNALSISSRIRIPDRACVTVSVSVRAPQIFLARWTSTGSISQVFLTGRQTDDSNTHPYTGDHVKKANRDGQGFSAFRLRGSIRAYPAPGKYHTSL
jgi:hypothetical protein